jgi:hypothetical protein
MPAPPQELEEDPDVQSRRGRSPMMLRAKTVKEFHSWMDDTIDNEIYKRVMRTRGITDALADRPRANKNVGRVIEKAFSQGR